jgi:hypothetical protein
LQELLVARTHEEAQEYQGYFEAGREVSLVEVVLSLAQSSRRTQLGTVISTPGGLHQNE